MLSWSWFEINPSNHHIIKEVDWHFRCYICSLISLQLGLSYTANSHSMEINLIYKSHSPISHNALFCNRNVHICAHLCYKMVFCWHLSNAQWDLWNGFIAKAEDGPHSFLPFPASHEMFNVIWLSNCVTTLLCYVMHCNIKFDNYNIQNCPHTNSWSLKNESSI